MVTKYSYNSIIKSSCSPCKKFMISKHVPSGVGGRGSQKYTCICLWDPVVNRFYL